MRFTARIRLVRSHWPMVMLEVATLCWGMGFSWAKNVGEAIDRAAVRRDDAAVGPLTGLAIRFATAAIVWAAVSRASRRGWTWRTVGRVSVIGGMLSLGLILQHLGLAATDEGTTAFLTNLTVIFVPLWVTAVTRRPPRRPLLIAIPIALAGMALLCNVGHAGSTAGALYGVACAIAFAAEIIILDHYGRRESPARLTLGTFVVIAVVCTAAAATAPGFADIHWPTLVDRGFVAELMPLIGLTTLLAFGLMTAYQPKVDPTRAAVIYLAEPVFAAFFAWQYNGRGLTAAGFAGACLILLANAIAEWKWRRV